MALRKEILEVFAGAASVPDDSFPERDVDVTAWLLTRSMLSTPLAAAFHI